MKLFLSEPMSRVGEEKVYDLTLDLGEIDGYPITGSEVEFFSLTAKADRSILVSVKGRADLCIPCGYCLKDTVVSVPFSETIRVFPDRSEDEFGDPVYFIEDHTIDTDEFIAEILRPEIPTRVLCREDCKGLCPVCGADLNEGPCGCTVPEAQSRLAALLEEALKNPGSKKSH